MTAPENPFAHDPAKPVSPGWTSPPPGYEGWPGAAPPGYEGWPGAAPPGYEGWPGAAPPRRAWYRAPASLIGASTFSAVFSWLTVAAIVGMLEWSKALDDMGGFEAMMLVLVLGLFFVFLFALGVLMFVLAVAGAIATVPLAVLWIRGPGRSLGAGLALAHAVVAWTVLGGYLVRLAA